MELLDELRRVVGDDACLSAPEALFAYECDGLTLHSGRPLAVVLPLLDLEGSAVAAVPPRGQPERVERAAAQAGLLGHGVVDQYWIQCCI